MWQRRLGALASRAPAQRAMERLLSLVVFVALALAPLAAAAQDGELRVATIEDGGWPQTVAALQSDLHAQGTAVHVVVFDAQAHVAPCGRYTLSLDDDGAHAFAIGTCDPSTSATELWLGNRAALFAHDGPVPRPRAIRLFATEVRYGDAAGGAATTGGAALDCSVGIRPYLDDLEHGGVVYLGPDRYEVHPTQSAVVVSVEPQGWSLHSSQRAALTIAYDVVERATGEVVLHDTATLACASGPVSSAAPPSVAPAPDPRLAAAASRVLILESTDVGRPAEVVAPIDMHEPVGDEATAMQMLRERAAELGADAVVGVEFHHGHGGGPIHLSGLAVRFVQLSG